MQNESKKDSIKSSGENQSPREPEIDVQKIQNDSNFSDSLDNSNNRENYNTTIVEVIDESTPEASDNEN